MPMGGRGLHELLRHGTVTMTISQARRRGLITDDHHAQLAGRPPTRDGASALALAMGVLWTGRALAVLKAPAEFMQTAAVGMRALRP